MKEQKRVKIITLGLFIVLAFLIMVAVNSGKVNLNEIDLEIAKNIFFRIRLPRVIAAVVVGLGLSLSGVLFQGLLNNPLADSYTLGISSGSAFGACLSIFISIKTGLIMPIQPFAIAFGILTMYLVLRIAKLRGSLESSSLILSGIIVGSVFSAGLSLLKSLADEDVASMVFWLMGNLSSKSMHQVLILAIVVIIGFIISMKYSHELNIITLGRDEAISVGVNYEKIYRLLIVTAAAMTGYCVSLCGIIGFVGLVVPHLARLGIGADNKKIIPISALLGATFLLTADTITRTILTHEIPVGIITTLVGGPFFMYIYLGKRGAKI